MASTDFPNEDAERTRKYLEYKEKTMETKRNTQQAQGLYTASGEFIPPEQVAAYFKKMGGSVPRDFPAAH